MLLQIHEPGQTPMPHTEDRDIAVGIDLGTTNSLVAIVQNDKAEVLSDVNGEFLHPSVVSYLDGDKIVTGRAALDSNGKKISSIKRLMGRGVKDIKKISGQLPYDVREGEGIVRIKIGKKELTPVEISAEILKSLKFLAEKALNRNINKAVITVPAYFDDSARLATKDAARIAGLDVLRLVNEPTAAALAYGLDKQAEGIYAVYDLGGGTFDISILRMEKGIFQVLATGGSVEIGGDDFDREIAEMFIWQCRNKTGKAITPSEDELHQILRKAKQAKEHLTNNKIYNGSILINDTHYDVTITLEELEKAIMPYAQATIDIFTQVVADAEITKDEIIGIVLVGGSTRIPLIKQMVHEISGKEPLSNIDPDKVVAEGAALQAHGLSVGSDNLLLDVLPLSLGLETMGGLVEKIIYRNTPIPVAKAQEFTTYQDGQTGMVINVVQGERETTSQNRSLAKFELKGIPPMKAGIARVKVLFSVDADGLLTVSASEETTGEKQIIEIKPSYGLSEKEIQDMLYKSMQHGKEDMEERLFLEAKIEAERLLIDLNSALKEDSALIGKEELQIIEKNKAELEKSLQNHYREEIIILTKKLEESSANFASVRMNEHIASALKGKNINEI